MRIVNSVKASSKDDLKLQFPTDCVQNGILTVSTQLIYLHLFLLPRKVDTKTMIRSGRKNDGS